MVRNEITPCGTKVLMTGEAAEVGPKEEMLLTLAHERPTLLE